MRSRRLLESLIVASLVALVCGADVRTGGDASLRSPILPPSGIRDKVTASDLHSGHFPQVVYNDYFMPIGQSTCAAHSIWTSDISLSTGLMTAPHMSGYGGNLVVILPGRIVALLFADECDPRIGPMIAAAEYYRREQGRFDRERDEKRTILR